MTKYTDETGTMEIPDESDCDVAHDQPIPADVQAAWDADTRTVLLKQEADRIDSKIRHYEGRVTRGSADDEDEAALSLYRSIREAFARVAAEPPDLDHDRMMLAKYQHEVSGNGKLERRIVWNLLTRLDAAGWQAHIVKADEDTEVHDPKSAMELLFNLDDAYLVMRSKASGREHWIRFVFGNGFDVISDYSYSERSDFGQIIEAFNPRDYA